MNISEGGIVLNGDDDTKHTKISKVGTISVANKKEIIAALVDKSVGDAVEFIFEDISQLQAEDEVLLSTGEVLTRKLIQEQLRLENVKLMNLATNPHFKGNKTIPNKVFVQFYYNLLFYMKYNF